MSIDNATPDEWDEAAYVANLAAYNARAELTPRDVKRLNQVLDQPFGDVPLVTRAYVFLLHQMGKIHLQQFSSGTRRIVARPGYRKNSRYQVLAVPQPAKKPSIDWSHVAPQYKWLARDSDGAAYVYVSKPCVGDADMWATSVHDHLRTTGFASYSPGDCDWKDSLVERPAGV